MRRRADEAAGQRDQRRGLHHEPPSGGSCEWYTPPWVFAALGLTFDLDPCAPALPLAEWIPARRRYSLPDDGLALPWEGRVWLNPPYAQHTARWVGKLAEHGRGDRVDLRADRHSVVSVRRRSRPSGVLRRRARRVRGLRSRVRTPLALGRPIGPDRVRRAQRRRAARVRPRRLRHHPGPDRRAADRDRKRRAAAAWQRRAGR